MVLTDGDGISIYYPEKLDDCSELQLELLKESQLAAKPLSLFAVEWMAAGCSTETWLKLNVSHSSEELADMAHRLADLILKSKAPLTRMPYGLLYLKNGEVLKGPDDYMSGLCFGQYVDAEMELFSFLLKKELSYLVRLVATIYRPVGEKEYNSDSTSRYLKPITATLTEPQLYVILEYYLGCRRIMESRFPNTFPRPNKTPEPVEGKTENVTSSGAETQITGKSILQMYLGFHAKMVQWAGTPDKKMQQYLVPVYTALEFIEADIKEYKRREKEIADLKRKQKHAA